MFHPRSFADESDLKQGTRKIGPEVGGEPLGRAAEEP